MKPSSPKDFRTEGYGQVEVQWGKERGILKGKLFTCSPSFNVIGRFLVTKTRGGHFNLKTIAGENYDYRKKDETTIHLRDMEHFVRELGWFTTSKSLLKAALYQKAPISVINFRNTNLFREHNLESHCDYFRVEFEVSVRLAFGNQDAIRKLSGEQLRTVHHLLRTTPWELWFHKRTKEFNLKELRYKEFNLYRARFNIKTPPPMMMTAYRLYSYLKDCREMGGNEVFDRATLFERFLGDPTWGPRARENADSRRLEAALEFLMYRGLKEAFPGKIVFERDIFVNRGIATGLQMMRGDPRLREGSQTPCMPSAQLTEIQKRAIQHVHRNKVTFLQGAPGTGKTEVLVGIMTHFAAPLVVTYVGMMVDALQGRFGKRSETASTIHYVCCTAEALDEEKRNEWLSQFDLIVIDEGSNVDTKLFSRLIRQTASYSSRLVIVGDLNQIYPIKPGAPFSSLVRRYPEHTFTLDENKRVDPDALSLAVASENIVRGREVQFNVSEALTLNENPSRETLEGILRRLVHSPDDIMTMQLVTLRNVERNMLNKWTEEILLERRILTKRPDQQVFIDGISYFPGKKVMFTKNVKEDGVRNGELGQILSVARNPVMITLTNGKQIKDPKYISPGYATTCNKSQGSEWTSIVFWMYENPNPFFTREYAYVAVSRARKQCIVVGTMESFQSICARKAPDRDCLLSYYLKDVSIPFCATDDVVLKKAAHLTLLPIDVPAVPLFPTKTTTADKRKKLDIS